MGWIKRLFGLEGPSWKQAYEEAMRDAENPENAKARAILQEMRRLKRSIDRKTALASRSSGDSKKSILSEITDMEAAMQALSKELKGIKKEVVTKEQAKIKSAA